MSRRFLRVKVDTNLTPNLIMHVMACGGVAGSRQYGRQHEDTIDPRDMAFLKSLTTDFLAKPPLAGGPLFTFLFQIPSYFPAMDFKDVSVVFRAMRRSISEGSLDYLERGLHIEESTLDEWIPRSLQSFFFAQLHSNLDRILSAVDHFTRIMQASYERFYKDYWPVTGEMLQKKALEIQKGLEHSNLLETWENVLGKTFPYPNFVVYLCEPCNSVSSLMAEKIVIPSHYELEKALLAIVHEAGVHFISPSDWVRDPNALAHFMRNRESLMRMQEAAICHLKSEVIERLGVEVEGDLFLSGMGLEKEVTTFSYIWESRKWTSITDAIREAYSKLSEGNSLTDFGI